MEIKKIDVSKARSIGLLITIDKKFFDEHRLRNTGYVNYDDIVFRIGDKERSFSYDEFVQFLGLEYTGSEFCTCAVSSHLENTYDKLVCNICGLERK